MAFQAFGAHTRKTCIALFILLILYLIVAFSPTTRYLHPSSIEAQSEHDHDSLYPEKEHSNVTYSPSTEEILDPVSTDVKAKVAQRPLRIALTETMQAHAEVWAALVYAFASQPNVEIRLFLNNPKYNMEGLVHDFGLRVNISDNEGVGGLDSFTPDVILSATCETDVNTYRDRWNTLLQRGRTYLLCLSHCADFQWEADHTRIGLSSWIEREMTTFLVLAPHVQAAFQSPDFAMYNWPVYEEVPSLRRPPLKPQDSAGSEMSTSSQLSDPPIEVFYPVFPAPTKGVQLDHYESGTGFAVQGYFSASRSYKGVLQDFKQLIERHKFADGENPTLHLIGANAGDGAPDIPDGLEHNAFIDEDLEYPQYYKLLSEMEGLLAAFAEERREMFLTTKASSSIAAPIIARTPLIIKNDTLQVYHHLNEDAVYVQGDEETVLDVLERILRLGEDERRRKKAAVGILLDTLLAENSHLVAGLLDIARRKIGWEIATPE